MRYLDLATASAWDVGRFLEGERLSQLDAYLDDREPEEEEDCE